VRPAGRAHHLQVRVPYGLDLHGRCGSRSSGRVIKLVAVILLGAGWLSGCATLSMERRKQEKPDVVIRGGGKVYEECLAVEPPQVMDYWFSASEPVKFNIHYHSDRAVYPVMGEEVKMWRGTFDPTCIRNYTEEKPPFFCLMWTNPHEEDVGLNFQYTFRDRE
jgi:hypothetical protein